ncbi:hypothetical protein EDC04DRAFT_2617700 [Pisolithus marmoratus]|nr:hypothetical protein EDC04DRAFT_2617700 [Pisolithus marmoratus]
MAEGWHMAGEWPLAKRVTMVINSPVEVTGLIRNAGVRHENYESDHFSDFLGVANDLLGNQSTALSTTSISRIWTPGKIHLKMRCTMPSTSLSHVCAALRYAVWFDREKLGYRHRQQGGTHCVYRAAKAWHTLQTLNVEPLQRCFQRKDVWNSDLGGYDASVISFGVVKLRSTIGFSSLCLPLSNSSGLPHSNPIINVGETVGWILEEGIVDGLELPPAYVHNRVSSGLYCWYWTYVCELHATRDGWIPDISSRYGDSHDSDY